MDNKFITNISGKDFIQFEGLLDLFHNNGGKSIYTKIISTDPLIFQATVKGEKGTFQGIGDADNGNVNSMIAKHKIRMAETRAIARALRWYNNIGMCSADELDGDSQINAHKPRTDVKPPETKPELGKNLVALKSRLKALGATDEKTALKLLKENTGQTYTIINNIPDEKAKSLLTFIK